MELDPEVLRSAEQLYREIHRFPELGWHEHQTVARVLEFLAAHDVPVSDSTVDPSVVIDIEGDAPGERVLLRADLDALPIEENTNLPFRSQVPGVMHACGHDLHTAILAALAVHKHRARQTLPGSLRLVFQPSEEANPSGAEALVAAGLADDVRASIALHIDPRLEVGRVAFRPGVTNAAVDGVGVTLTAPGGHAARPHLSVDLARVCALCVLELGDLVRRTRPAHEAAVLTMTTIETGKRSNIIADRAWLDGTLRTFSNEARNTMIDAIRTALDGITKTHGAEYELDLRVGQPALVNDRLLSQLAHETVNELLGANGFHELDHPSLGADDFSVFGEKSPIMMMRLGVAGKDGVSDLHTPTLRVDTSALPIGIRLLSQLADRAAATPNA